ncbi:MAG TPA: hypothetical protein VFB36_15445 [Nevskiaceae bacterium]|nr:hypothetical protein [Nevskiaceae bacterium]
MQQRVAGVTLIEVLKHKSTFDEPALKGVLLPLADALEQAHDAHKLHLSISPVTIVLQGGATPMFIGFGADVPPDAGYSAIERYSTEYKTGKWTDIYSLGAVAYRLIAGVPPPAAGARLEGEPMRSAVEIGARNYHKSLLEAVDWALKVHPLERPQTLAQWKDALIGLRESATSGGAAAGATMPITATMVRKFAEARQTNPAASAPPPAAPASVAPPPRPAPANVTPIPPPLVEKPKPAPAPAAPPPPKAPEPVRVVTPPPRIATPPPAQPARAPTPLPKVKAPSLSPPPRDEPFPESPPTRPSLWSAVIAVVVLGTAIGYAWFARRPTTPAAAPAPVTQAALQPAPPAETRPAPQATPPATAVAPAPAASPPPPPAPVAVAPVAPAVPAPAAAPAPIAAAPPTTSKLQGNWVGRASYASVLRGLDCSAEVTRTWKTSITGASADGKTLTGTFSTALRADGDNTCPKTRYDLQIDGDFVARVQSPSALQLTSKVKSCAGDCDDNRGLLIPKTLNRTYRVSVSAKSDRLSFSDNATDFALKRSP